MNKVLGWLDTWRRNLWRAAANDQEASWVSHFLLVSIGTFVPAGVVDQFFGGSWGILCAVWLSELWLLFFAGREVVDYLRAAAMLKPRKTAIRDGVGDLIGPVLVHLLCWVAFLSGLGG